MLLTSGARIGLVKVDRGMSRPVANASAATVITYPVVVSTKINIPEQKSRTSKKSGASSMMEKSQFVGTVYKWFGHGDIVRCIYREWGEGCFDLSKVYWWALTWVVGC